MIWLHSTYIRDLYVSAGTHLALFQLQQPFRKSWQPYWSAYQERRPSWVMWYAMELHTSITMPIYGDCFMLWTRQDFRWTGSIRHICVSQATPYPKIDFTLTKIKSKPWSKRWPHMTHLPSNPSLVLHRRPGNFFLVILLSLNHYLQCSGSLQNGCSTGMLKLSAVLPILRDYLLRALL